MTRKVFWKFTFQPHPPPRSVSIGSHERQGSSSQPAFQAMNPQGILKAFPKRKKIHADPPSKALAKIPKQEVGEAGEWLSSLRAHIIPTGIGRARAELFEKQIIHHGGQICSAQAPGVTHIVVDENMDCERALRLLRLPQLPPSAQLVKSTWLSLCLQERRLIDTAGFSVCIPKSSLDQPQPNKADESTQEAVSRTTLSPSPPHTRAASPPAKAEKAPRIPAQLGSDDETSDEEGPQVSSADLEALISGHYPAPLEKDGGPDPVPEALEKWVCAQPSSQKATNYNQHITEKLEVLAKAYSVQGDKWRALGYAKAINALKSFHKPVSSYQEACGIPGIGKRMAEKIVEILESGHLRKLDHISDSVPVLELFSNIWGAGTKTAQMWYHQGFRNLEDIRSLDSLTTQQAIGLKHYDDFLERMPREEAADIEKTVRISAQAFNPGLLCVACGSYRRGKMTCGDVDVLITHPDGRSHQGIFSRLLDSLRQQGFLTDDLVSHEENGQQQKYLGVCRLPGPKQRHRRLDIIVVPYSEFACALLYFTGSAHFNRSMRALAKTKGMSLSEHALSAAVVRNSQGVKVGPGRVLPTPTEKDVFRLLGLPYREPAERDW
ncbi:DNA polymerase lambda isoform X1 [Cricetulus griseus]|uniref:DNA polymerase n=2 Tax=Cricetulus griseus TaxID=10029 RepID=A0A9J7JD36_CRIGR|nr:DNA polymerase lambda isoform X1 [Cricetulus griseus]